jgi:hypothetical protein
MGDLIPNDTAAQDQLDAENLISQLKQIVDDPRAALQHVDDSQRNEIQRLSMTASRAMEQPFETMMKLAYVS